MTIRRSYPARACWRAVILGLTMSLLALVTPGPATHAQQGPDLSAALLELSDLPSGWRDAPYDELADLEDEDTSLPDPCEIGPTLQPRDVAIAVFLRSEIVPIIQHSVALLEPGEAEQAVAYIRDEFGDCGDISDDGTTITVSELPIPSLGEDSFALRYTEESGFGVYQTDVVVARRGNALFILASFSDVRGESVDPDLLGSLARVADMRLLSLVGGKSKG